MTLTIEPGTTLLFQDGTDIMGSSYTGTLASPANVAASSSCAARLIADGTTPHRSRSVRRRATRAAGTASSSTRRRTTRVVDNVTISRAQYALTYASTGANNVITNSTADTAQYYGLWLRTGRLDVRRLALDCGTYELGIYIGESASPTLTNCVVRNSGSYGVQHQLTRRADRRVALTNCTINANGT